MAMPLEVLPEFWSVATPTKAQAKPVKISVSESAAG